MLDTILTMLLLVAGLAFWVRLGLVARAGRPLLAYQPRAEIQWNPIVLVVVGGWLMLVLANNVSSLVNKINGSSGPRDPITLRTVQSNCLIGIATYAIFLFLLSEAGRRPLAAFGISFKNWRRHCLTGILAFLAAIPLVILVSMLISLVEPDREPQHSLLRLLQKDGTAETITWITMIVVVLAPLSEELVFRVILQGSLRTRLNPTEAIAFSSLVFVLVHPFPDMLALLPLAIVFGYVYERTHSYVATVTTHAVFNGVMLGLSLLE